MYNFVRADFYNTYFKPKCLTLFHRLIIIIAVSEFEQAQAQRPLQLPWQPNFCCDTEAARDVNNIS